MSRVVALRFVVPACACAALLLAPPDVRSDACAASGRSTAADKPAAPARPPAVKPAPASSKAPPPSTEPVALIPKGWDRSIYDVDGRVVTAVRDVTFQAPPAYQESFAFWTGRMKGGQRTELIQLLTTTGEPAADGSLPFRRQVSRFQVDIIEQGQYKSPAGGLMQQVNSLAWEGALDAQGNVREIKMTRAPDKPDDIDQLSFELLDLLFPRLGGRRDLKPGDSFSEKIVMRLPQRLAVKGVEEMRVLVSRDFTLRDIRGNLAIFHIKVGYVADPATPPSAPKTVCTIAGGGTGEATFNRDEGLFVSTEMETNMVIDLEAPLRRLPDQPEDFDPGSAKSRIDLVLNMSAKQTLARLFVDSPEAPAAEGAADEKPSAPGS